MANETTTSACDRAHHRQRRSAARLRAVQALYQRAMAGTPVDRLVTEFHSHRLEADDLEEEVDGGTIASAEVAFFDDLVRGVSARQDELDLLLARYLAPGWTLARLDPLLLQLLRAGAYELVARADVPLAAIITAYVDIAHAFVPRQEAGFVNALLDRLGHAVRGGSERGAA
ncbi:transcription antitermination factor NusB [Thermaurantiacus sp.]